jgi:hypothetical protein
MPGGNGNNRGPIVDSEDNVIQKTTVTVNSTPLSTTITIDIRPDTYGYGDEEHEH